MKRKPRFGFVRVPPASGFPEVDFNLGDLLVGNPAGTKYFINAPAGFTQDKVQIAKQRSQINKAYYQIW